MSGKKISIEGKVVLVSGSNRGIGKAITIELLENGAKKVYAGDKIGSLDNLKKKYGNRLVPIKLDVTKKRTINKVAKIANDVEILVNNAGISASGNFLSGHLVDSLQDNLDVNVFGLVKLTNALIRTIKKAESGAIVNVSSVLGLANKPSSLTYSASKAAVHSITQGLRGELKNSNILVSGVYPGAVDTEMIRGLDMKKETPENVAKEIIKGIENGIEDIFPDVMSKQIGEEYASNPKAIEKKFSKFV